MIKRWYFASYEYNAGRQWGNGTFFIQSFLKPTGMQVHQAARQYFSIHLKIDDHADINFKSINRL